MSLFPNRELPRTPVWRSSQNSYSTHFVNKLRQAPSQAPSDHTGSRIACGLLRGLLLLSVLAREVRRPVHDDQNNRHHAPTALYTAKPGSPRLLLRTSG